MSEPQPGDKVVVKGGGRHRGSKGILIAIESTPTPAGGVVFIARIKRPRAGDTFTFAHEIEKVE